MGSLVRSPPAPGADDHGRFVITLEQCVPFVIALLVLAIELTPAHFLYTGPFLTATPALAALTMGPRGTMATAGVALTVSVITATYNEAWGSDQVYSNLAGLLLVSAASITTSNAVRTRRQSELDQIRRIASAAQEVILRPVPARLGPLRAASTYLAAETGARIGGDLYEAVYTRYGVRLIVGDVRGKGLHAVRAAAAVLSAFREAVHYEDDLVEVVDHCAAALRREGAVTGAVDEDDQVEEFVTVLVAQVPDTPVVQLVNRGHPPPLVLSHGKVHPLLPTSPLPPLGLEGFFSGPPAKAESYPFAPGDRLLLYTDGVIEARNRDNGFFPLPEAMEAVHPCTPPEFLHDLHGRLMHHTEGWLADDVAMVVIDRIDT
ncbi:PP2C family protein-serine/threonine phosphatase [Streptomyces coffeae]|uniref:Serine/threonine-protein phosphatase n=1 Tax=Streptomyces coffeae TaxID=621382 RepID=A0ABS1N831_9ACTN|nr:PP2C family protein-serine/threonine phosphatase [Streptomyces coffeae]MBL1096099.1 serine/threonine-protein phosphatase [Streptomyces coffeae]